jgi:mRNA interferase MazF
VNVPDEGDLIWLDFDPQSGREQAGRRPGLVLTPASYHRRSSYAIVCPITSNTKPYPYKVALPAGLAISGIVLADQAKSIDRAARDLKIVGKAPADVLNEVRSRLASLIMPGIIP